MGTEIRAASPDDVALLIPLVAAYWSFEGIEAVAPERVAPQLARLLGDPGLGGGWLALESGRAVGYLLAVYVFSLEHLGLTAEIDEFYLAPEHRNLGLGVRLLNAAEAAFRAAGCTNVSLQVGRGNTAARAFYLRQGYTAREGYELLDKMLLETA